jgi:hypothetical protein
MEEQIEAIHRSTEKLLNGLEPGKLKAYNDLLIKQKDLQEKVLQSENRLEKKIQSLKKESEARQEELDIANLEPREAQSKFVARYNTLKQNTKLLDEQASSLKQEIANAQQKLQDLKTKANNQNNENGDELEPYDLAKYELLQKRNKDMTTFIDSFVENKQNILLEQKQVQSMIVSLLEHISKSKNNDNNETEEDKILKKKLNPSSNSKEALIEEKLKLEKDLKAIQSSELSLENEKNELKEKINQMKNEMMVFSDETKLNNDFNSIKNSLVKLKESYLNRRETAQQKILSISSTYEDLIQQLNSDKIAASLQQNEKQIQQNEKSIFMLQQFLENPLASEHFLNDIEVKLYFHY